MVLVALKTYARPRGLYNSAIAAIRVPFMGHGFFYQNLLKYYRTAISNKNKNEENLLPSIIRDGYPKHR